MVLLPPFAMLFRIGSRLLTGIGLVLVIVSITFLLINVAPGDPARVWLGPGATASDLENVRQLLGLDRPLGARYVAWIGSFISGDWGTSLLQQRPVSQVLLDALPYTLRLSIASLLVTYVGGVLLGAFQAARAGTRTDNAITTGSLLVFGMPAYWLAAMLILVFSFASARLGWPPWLRFPAIGASSLDAEFMTRGGQFVDSVRHLALPLLTLGAIGVAGTTRFVRAAILDVDHQSYVRAAHARGLPTQRIQWRYIARNALAPVITLLGLSLPALFSGTVFVEVMFAWPGLGREIVGAVVGRDYPVVMATTAIFAALVVLGNVLADLIKASLDPRQRGGSP